MSIDCSYFEYLISNWEKQRNLIFNFSALIKTTFFTSNHDYHNNNNENDDITEFVASLFFPSLSLF